MTILSWTEDYGEEVNGYNLSALTLDECYVNLINHNSDPVHLTYKFKECEECPFRILQRLPKVSTKYDQIFRVVNSSKNVLCELNPGFGEFGVYNIHVNHTKCSIETLHEDVSIYFPILTVFLIYLSLYIVLFAVTLLVKKVYKRNQDDATQAEENKKVRLKSLDTFRGFSIIFMIFVNYGAGGYEVLEHATWHGLHFADLVFPWFLWIMGVCVPISISSAYKKGFSKQKIALNILRRSCILFALGLFLGSGQYLNNLRIFGVLQRFGICYLFIGLLFVSLSKKEELLNNEIQCVCQDFLKIKYQWLVILTVIIVHCLLIFFLPVPGCPTGYFGPGGLHLEGKFFNCTGGATGYVDRIILGQHIYQYPTIGEVYDSGPFDPEGILGSLTSIVQVFLGVQAGLTLITFKEHLRRITRWILWGLATGLIGGLLCKFSKNEGFIPLNKNLWTISFVLVTSSLAFMFLTVCYFIIDVKKWWTGKPIMFAGMNSTIMYVGHSLVFTNFPFHWYTSVNAVHATHFIELIKNVWSTNMWILVAYYLYAIKFFLSI